MKELRLGQQGEAQTGLVTMGLHAHGTMPPAKSLPK